MNDERRALRLLLWYPPDWRARYGAEFAELLLADLAERPGNWRRAADVARAGLRARLAGAGLAAHPLDSAKAARRRLATLACCAAVAVTFSTATWSQLATGLQWANPGNGGIAPALAVMSAALLLLALLALPAVTILARAVITARARGAGRKLGGPLLLVIAGALILLVGGRHFQNGWPGTGGHLLARYGMVPGGVAAFGWASTLWITSYLAHPALLGAFPATELAWMAASPAAITAVVTGSAGLLLRVELSPRESRSLSCLGHAAGAGTVVLLGGGLAWLAAARHGPALLHAGALDRADLAVVALAVAVGAQALRHARSRVPAPAAGRPGQ